MKKYLLVILPLTFLMSCAPSFMGPNNFSSFRKGETAEVMDNLDIDPEYIMELGDVNGTGKNFRVYVYKVYHYHRTSYIMNVIPVTSGAFSYGMYAFDENGLYYWGFLEDFMKSENDIIREVGELAANQIRGGVPSNPDKQNNRKGAI